MNTRTDLVRFTHQKPGIIRSAFIALLMAASLLSLDPSSANAAPGLRTSGPSAGPDVEVENYKFFDKEIREMIWNIEIPSRATGTARSCHPDPRTRDASAKKLAMQRAVKNLELQCDQWWDERHRFAYNEPTTCEVECSDPWAWAELNWDFNPPIVGQDKGDKVLEVLRAEEGSAVRIWDVDVSTYRGCAYYEAKAAESCHCDCKAVLGFSRNP
jgi:hypothetical protein